MNLGSQDEDKDNEDDYADQGGSQDDDENNVKGGPS